MNYSACIPDALSVFDAVEKWFREAELLRVPVLAWEQYPERQRGPRTGPSSAYRSTGGSVETSETVLKGIASGFAFAVSP